MKEELQLRIHGEAPLPALIYLPGLHGDWTLIGSFRKTIGGRARFVEITYPRTLTWSLDDYAAAIETALARNGITRGWLLGESYGSQVLWAMVGRAACPAPRRSSRAAGDTSNRNCESGSSGASPHQAAENNFKIEGVILAGGCVKHPMRWAVRLAEKLTGRISTALFVRIIFGYAKIARFRYRRSPETLATIDEFVARRTELDRRAAQHRLHLIAQYDPRLIAGQTKLPVFGLSGILDPIVPWPWVRRWLRKNCPALRDYRIIHSADHNVLSTAPKEAVKQVLDWMNQQPEQPMLVGSD
jgi:pimeloyl-ACP methyl ester carboxylesterase